MSIPETITNALAGVQADKDNLDLATADAAAKAEALAGAQHAKEVADSTAQAASGQLASDRQALITLIEQTYATATPALARPRA